MLLGVRASGLYGDLLLNSADNQRLINQSTERLATALRINRAQDDPAGLIAAEQLRGDLLELRGRQRATAAERRQLNIQQSGRQVTVDTLQSLRGRVVEAADGTLSDEQRQAIQYEIDQALTGLDSLSATVGITLPADLEQLRSGSAANVVDGDPALAAQVLDEQIAEVNRARAEAGAYERYTLDIDERVAAEQSISTAAALSDIVDADFAEESSNLIRAQILDQSALRTLLISSRSRADQVAALLRGI